MRGLKAALLLLLAAAVAISGSLSYLLGALARTDTAAKGRVGALRKPSRVFSLLSFAARDVGHNAELRSLWRAFDAAAVATQAGVQNQLNLKARTLLTHAYDALAAAANGAVRAPLALTRPSR